MQFRSESTIAHSREAVFSAYRDQLADIVRYLDDIREVNVLSRDEEGAVVKLHNEWVSDRDIPAAASAFLKPEHLRWDDYANWDSGAWQCRFEIRTRAFGDAVRCDGTNTFVPDPGGTRVILEGNFHVDLKGLPGVPSFVAKRLVPQVEKFIIALIQPNLERTNEAVGRYLDSRS
jgi:hypothetical protein